MPTKRERLEEFYRRLGLAPAASTYDEALALIRKIMNDVEDELSGVPMDPDPPLKSDDGRMYPPKGDLVFEIPGRPAVIGLQSRRHHSLVGDNGAIEIRSLKGVIEFSKPGADGRSINDL